MTARDEGSVARPATSGPTPRVSARLMPRPTVVHRVALDPGNAWRVGWTLVAVVAGAAFGWFVLNDAGSIIYLIVLSWFASLALEPAVRRLARYMRRGAATALVMVAVTLFLALFLFAFGQLFLQQIAQLLELLPSLIQGAMDWVNRQLGTDYSVNDVFRSLNLTPDKVTGYVNGVLGGVLGLLGSLAGTLLQGFSFVLLTFYLSSDGPRLRRWLASHLPAGRQELFVTAWDLTTLKTGDYVAARALLAGINAATSAVVFAVIGLPSWLALALWTGLVAQFVPTIGTYISIVLPVLVGLMSPEPWTGVAVLVWGVAYQQIENLTLEPRLSARAVNVHPAVAFIAVLAGTALFGLAGALLAVPVSAMLLALVELRIQRHALIEDAEPAVRRPAAAPVPDDSETP